MNLLPHKKAGMGRIGVVTSRGDTMVKTTKKLADVALEAINFTFRRTDFQVTFRLVL
jgi:hypothetical protein